MSIRQNTHAVNALSDELVKLSYMGVAIASHSCSVPHKPKTTGKRVLQIANHFGIKDAELARMLGVEPQTVNEYKKRANANPRPDKIVRFLTSLGQTQKIDVTDLEHWLSQEPGGPMPAIKKIGKSAGPTQTDVYYNEVSKNRGDSLPDSRTVETFIRHADPRIVSVNLMVGGGSRVWSAKDARRDDVTVFEYVLVGGRILVKVEGDSLSPDLRSKVLAFRPEEQPKRGPFLLCSQKVDPDLLTIRYIPIKGPGDQLFSPEPGIEPEGLGAWDVIGFADYLLTPHEGEAPDVIHSPRGVWP
jgi:transcriptional regulator with XRE-family HTH domain